MTGPARLYYLRSLIDGMRCSQEGSTVEMQLSIIHGVVIQCFHRAIEVTVIRLLTTPTLTYAQIRLIGA